MNGVTLLSDFGSRDGSVAAVKAILMQFIQPNHPIVDISHEVEPRLNQQAAYLLRSTYNFFQSRTVHLILMDVFYNKHPKMIVAEVNNHFFIAPDNGLLPYTFEQENMKVWECFQLSDEQDFKDWLRACAQTVKNLLEHGEPDKLYHSYDPISTKDAWKPYISENSIECHVIHIDRYENVVLNVTRQQIEEVSKGRNFTINFYGHSPIQQVSQRYTDVKISQPLCRFNHAGYLELAINGGSAATILGFTIRKEQHLIYNIVKLEFES